MACFCHESPSWAEGGFGRAGRFLFARTLIIIVIIIISSRRHLLLVCMYEYGHVRALARTCHKQFHVDERNTRAEGRGLRLEGPAIRKDLYLEYGLRAAEVSELGARLETHSD